MDMQAKMHKSMNIHTKIHTVFPDRQSHKMKESRTSNIFDKNTVNIYKKMRISESVLYNCPK